MEPNKLKYPDMMEFIELYLDVNENEKFSITDVKPIIGLAQTQLKSIHEFPIDFDDLKSKINFCYDMLNYFIQVKDKLLTLKFENLDYDRMSNNLDKIVSSCMESYYLEPLTTSLTVYFSLFLDRQKEKTYEFLYYIEKHSQLILEYENLGIDSSKSLLNFNKNIGKYLEKYLHTLIETKIKSNEDFEELIININKHNAVDELTGKKSKFYNVRHYSNLFLEQNIENDEIYQSYFKDALFLIMEYNPQRITLNTLMGTLSLFTESELNDKVYRFDNILDNFDYSDENVFSFILNQNSNLNNTVTLNPFLDLSGCIHFEIFDKILKHLDEHNIWDRYELLINNETSQNKNIRSQFLESHLKGIINRMSFESESIDSYEQFIDVLLNNSMQLDNNFLSHDVIHELAYIDSEKMNILSQGFSQFSLESFVKLFITKEKEDFKEEFEKERVLESLNHIISKKVDVLNQSSRNSFTVESVIKQIKDRLDDTANNKTVNKLPLKR